MRLPKEDLKAIHSDDLATFRVNVETKGLDEAITKIKELITLLKEANELANSLLDNSADT